ncbi:MAG: Trk system potassium transporter TrkA [Granulosicoccus sp.]
MKIIVLGAGQVGQSVARSLAAEQNDLVVVDTDIDALKHLEEVEELQTVVGYASHPEVLKEAGAEDADMIIAATDSDETNIVAVQIAYSLYRTPQKIARIRSAEYAREKDLFKNDNIPIDTIISPEQLITDHVERIIEHPGAIQVVDFAGGRVRLVGVRAQEGAPMDGWPLSHLTQLLNNIDTRVVAVYRGSKDKSDDKSSIGTSRGRNEKKRGGARSDIHEFAEKSIIPDGKTVIHSDDVIFFMGKREDTIKVMAQFHHDEVRCKRIMIAGGGNIGLLLARKLEERYEVKLVEMNPKRAQHLASMLGETQVHTGDAADLDLMKKEYIEAMDVYCALTNDDEANILSAMLAKKKGAGKVMSLINRPAYVDLIEDGMIDVAISPQQITIGALLTLTRRGDVIAVHSLRRGEAEALEGVAKGDLETSKLVGRCISDISLPESASIGVVVRGDKVMIAHHDLMIESEDHLILLITDKREINAVEKLFQVGFSFV